MRRRRKNELIPLARTRRVIYVSERRRRGKYMPLLGKALAVLGAVCLLYCLAILFFIAHGTRFYLVWGVLGLCLMGAGALLARTGFWEGLPGWARWSVGILAAAGLFLFLLVEGCILSRFGAGGEPGADYCIVLGAQMKENGPSDVLRRRLDAAVSYLEENPGTKVIVSGGRGADESASEAQGMREYLLEKGIAGERILTEDASANTRQNLEYSAGLLDREKDSVVVVTNNFHVYRALGIARRLGYENISGLAGSTALSSLPNNLLREFFGVLKDALAGNL